MPQMQVKNNILFPFMKMHGLGNDFVVIDARAQSLEMTESLARALGDRRRGVGFDQLAVILRTDSVADAYLKFYNSDGSTAGACGNATRCIARHLMDETGEETLSLETEHGILFAKDMGNQITSINMGHPDLDWQEIPLSQSSDTLELPIDGSPTAIQTCKLSLSYIFFVSSKVYMGIFRKLLIFCESSRKKISSHSLYLAFIDNASS